MALRSIIPIKTHVDTVEPELVEHFEGDVRAGAAKLEDIGKLSAVVGIPFFEDPGELRGLIRTARAGLQQAGLGGKSMVIVVGGYEGDEELARALSSGEEPVDVPVHGFLLSQGLEGRGWSLRAILEVCGQLGTPVVALSPELVPAGEADGEAEGFSPSWIPRLLAPVLYGEQDLSIGRYKRAPMTNVVESLFAYPLISGIFGICLRQPISGIYSLSHKAVRACVTDTEMWPSQTGTYGMDPWLVTRVVTEELSICEVPLGTARFHSGVGSLKRMFRQITHSMLDQVDKYSSWWLERIEPLSAPLVAGSNIDMPPMSFEVDAQELLLRFKAEFDHFDDTLYRELVPEVLRRKLEVLADDPTTGGGLSAEEWIGVMREFVFAHRFETRFHRDDIVDGLFPFFLARLATFTSEVMAIESVIAKGKDTIDADIAELLVRRGAELIVEKQAHLFIDNWGAFRKEWRDRTKESSSYLPRLCAWEFVPHVEVIMPQELKDIHGNPVFAADVYQELLDRYRSELMTFLSAHLGLDELADSGEILARLRRFMSKVNWTLDVDIFPFDLTTREGTQQMVDKVCQVSMEGETFHLTPKAANTILKRIVPRKLISRLGFKDLFDGLEAFDPLDILGMAAWADKEEYLAKVLDIVETEADPSWFAMTPLKPVVLEPEQSSRLVDLRGSSALSRLAGRVVVGTIPKGSGGEYPKLLFYLRLLKGIVAAERFSRRWKQFSKSSIEFGERVVASIRGHWGRRVLSAHNAFANFQQRILVERIRAFAVHIRETEKGMGQAAELLEAMASVYHLSITLPDATFVPLSAWTWASYSARGGFGVPTPLSSLVERDWATRDFLTAYLKRTGRGDEDTVHKKIIELIGKGQESDDLSRHLFGVDADAEELIVTQTRRHSPPAATKLVRPVEGPVLEPIAEHEWESRYVLNAAVVRLDGTIYILYRAFGNDKISRVGLAWTTDGIHMDGRLDKPIFQPEGVATEVGGCEDPRVIVIGDRLYMLYTAFDGRLPQIAMASIPVAAFLERRFDAWERHGLGFPGLSNKDAVLYPEKFNNQYVVYHRIDPNMYISYLDTLTCPWPRTGQKIVVGPRPGMMWDGIKIGAGAQPIKTTHGWLNIYHGVDYAHTYRLGVLFMDKNDPSKVLYRSPNPILEPEYDFEIGKTKGGDFWVPRVVFTCGAVPEKELDVVGPDDDILVYYGAADTAIGVAKGTLRDMVPILDT